MLGTGLVSSDERKVNVSAVGGGKLALSLLGSLPKTLNRKAILGEVDALLLLELADHVVEDSVVEILTTEESVTVGGLNLEDTTHDFKNGNIEGTTTKIVDSDETLLLVTTISKGSGSGLVDDTLDIKTGNATGVLGGLTLGIVEVGRDSNNGLRNGMTKVSFGGFLHLGKSEGTDLTGRVLLVTGLNPSVTVGSTDNLVRDHLGLLLGLGVVEETTNKTLGGVNSVGGIGDGLTLGGKTNEPLTLVSKGNNGRSGTGTLSIFNNLGSLALHNGNARVRSTEINANHLIGTSSGRNADASGKSSALRESAPTSLLEHDRHFPRKTTK
mmetsp:Transcript_1594/g.2302  ORF Transcript_1594/g.2302 Transcript_1594/m.2302 type:complete len:327 (+) Transcript_1594:1405-2385(+)